MPVYNNTGRPITIKKGAKVARISPVYQRETTQLITEETLDAIAHSDTVNFLNVTDEFLNSEGEVAMAADAGDEPASPPLPAKEVPRYGMAKPDSYPVITDCHGVEICADNPEYAEKLKTILDKYHIYHDRGLIPIPDEDKMRIELLDGWQNQKQNVRVFPLGLEDMELLNEQNDRQHKIGKIGWQQRPAVLACPLL